MFETILKLVDLVSKDAPVLGKLFADIEAEFAKSALTSAPHKVGVDLIGIKLWRKFVSGVLQRHLVTELTNTGLVTSSQAQTMVDTGMQIPGPHTNGVKGVGAAGGILSNITTWIETNLPQLLQEFVTLAPVIIQLISLFSAL